MSSAAAGGFLAVEHAAQIAHVLHTDLAAFELNDDLLRLGGESNRGFPRIAHRLLHHTWPDKLYDLWFGERMILCFTWSILHSKFGSQSDPPMAFAREASASRQPAVKVDFQKKACSSG
jgi:hypothetical protein